MSFHMSSLLTFLLITGFGGLRPNLATTDANSPMVPNNAGSAVIAYWQKTLPLSTMPSAIRDLLSPKAEANAVKPVGVKLNPTVDSGKHANNGDDLNPAILYGKETVGVNNLNPAIIYGKETVGVNDLNPAIIYGKETVGVNDLNPAIIYAKETVGVNDLNPAILYGKETVGVNDLNPAILYGKETVGVKMNPTVDFGKQANNGNNLNPAMHILKDADRHVVHEHSHFRGGHDHLNLRNIAFLEDALTPGSKVSPYIHPASSPGAHLLPRDVADSIPMSTKSFTDILRMFAPVSRDMADSIRQSLELCEHPHPAKGEKKECVTSIESMVELAASVLRTGDIRAFSSPSVPMEGRTASKVYTVVAVKTITSPGDTMTCHGIPFPYKVFVCHALVPTKVYSVTVESDGVKEKIEALVVCHLNTAEFDPMKMPPHVKPGDAPVCHFLNKDDILWAPSATTLGTQGAANVTVAAQ